MPAPPPVPPPGSLRLKLVNVMTDLNVTLYRATGGRVGGSMRGAPILLLHHIGRRSGQRRTTPLLYLEDGANLVLVASAGGRSKHPAWWLNLRARPQTTVQVRSQQRSVVAREATSEEREVLWPRLVAMYGDYAVYQQRTDRQIPVVILEPA